MKVSWETNVSVIEYKKSCKLSVSVKKLFYPDPRTSTVSELYEQNNKPFDVWKKIQIASVSTFLTFVMKTISNMTVTKAWNLYYETMT